jgi:hypothetical protein
MASASIRPPKPESMPARFNYPSLPGNPDSTQPKSAVGDHTRKLFGSPLYRTVATTASVALQRDIDWQQVREWLKP